MKAHLAVVNNDTIKNKKHNRLPEIFKRKGREVVRLRDAHH